MNRLNGTKRVLTTAILALVLAACSKSENQSKVTVTTSEEQQVLDQSVFYPGNLAPQVNVLAAVSGGETGSIPNPFSGGGTAEGGTIAPPGGSTGGTSSGGSPSGGTTSGGTSSGTTSGGTVSGGTTSGGTSSGGTTSGGSSSGTVSGGSTTPSGGSDGGTIPGGPGTGSGGDGGTVSPGGPVAGGPTPAPTPGPSTGGSPGGTPGTGGPVAGGPTTSPSPGTTPGTPGGNDGGTVGTNPGTPGGNDGGTVGTNPGTPGGNDGGSNPGGPVAGGPTPAPTPGPSTGGSPGGTPGSGGPVAGGPTASPNPGTTPGAPGGNDGGTVGTNPGTPGGNDGGSHPGGPVAGGPTPLPSPNPGGNDGGTVGGNPGGTPGGNDGGSTDPCAVASHKGNNGVGNGLDPQPPGNPPINDGPGTGPGHPGNKGGTPSQTKGSGKDARIAVCPVKQEIEIKFSRVCSQMRSNIPYPKFVFYEEMRRPTLAMEAQVPVSKNPMLAMGMYLNPRNYMASHGQRVPRGTQVDTYLIESRSLAQVDLFEGRWKGNVSYDLSGLKSKYPKEWRDSMINLFVCDDRDGDGLCGEEGSPWIVSVNRPAFTPTHVPKSVQMDVWHGRFMLLKTDPEYCEKQMSPIVLDLAGNGIKLQGPESGTLFDLQDDGDPVYTGWTASLDDAFLVRDLNGNGRIDSGAELFGSATILKNGRRASSGFQALAELDDDKDGLITRKDSVWKTLRLWVDQNRNGISEKGEIVSLDAMGVESLTVGYADMAEVDVYGNETRMRSTFRRRIGGQSKAMVMVDVWFNTINRRNDTAFASH